MALARRSYCLQVSVVCWLALSCVGGQTGDHGGIFGEGGSTSASVGGNGSGEPSNVPGGAIDPGNGNEPPLGAGGSMAQGGGGGNAAGGTAGASMVGPGGAGGAGGTEQDAGAGDFTDGLENSALAGGATLAEDAGVACDAGDAACD